MATAEKTAGNAASIDAAMEVLFGKLDVKNKNIISSRISSTVNMLKISP